MSERMFAQYDYSNFPIINITLNNTIENDNDFNNFINEWINLNNNKKKYKMIFDTQNCGFINPKYCFYMAMFIKKMKKEKIKYLQKSQIIVYNNYILKLLELIFYFEKPIAPVEICLKNNNDIIKIININI